MVAKYVKYGVVALLAVLLGSLACSENLRYEVTLLWTVATGDAVDKLELQVDQGSLALQRFDNAYVRAQQKLSQLQHVYRDTQLSITRSRERARDLRAQGKEDLALRNDEQAELYAGQLSTLEQNIEHRSAKLIELKSRRERAREDVRLARERIAMLVATRDALDQTGMQETLERAEQNIRNLQSNCNKLSAEIDVLNLTED